MFRDPPGLAVLSRLSAPSVQSLLPLCFQTVVCRVLGTRSEGGGGSLTFTEAELPELRGGLLLPSVGCTVAFTSGEATSAYATAQNNLDTRDKLTCNKIIYSL